MQTTQQAIFAGGCFWCIEPAFSNVNGVLAVSVGYSGGSEANPTYQQVASGSTTHFEAVLVIFDPAIISFQQLIEIFWRQIDPTDAGGQFADQGAHYRTAIFYHDQAQQQIAQQAKQQLSDSKRFAAPIVTQILPATKFWRAETYHQNFACKNPERYRSYRHNSGRSAFIEKNWQD